MTVFLPSSNKFAIACGTAGAFVEVTSDVVFNEGNVTRSWGRTSGFSDATPGNFAFTLDNRNGKYTPGFKTNIAPVVVPLAKGMGVSWDLNGQIRSGRIRSVVPIFPPEGKEDAARVRVTVDDVLAIAARTTVDSQPQSLVKAATPYLWWPLDDAAGSFTALEVSGNNAPPLVNDPSQSTLGASGVPAVSTTQVEMTDPSSGTGYGLSAESGLGAVFPTITYPTNSIGTWGFWFTQTGNQVPRALFSVATNIASPWSFTTSGGYYCIADLGGGNAISSGVPVVANVPAYVSVDVACVLSGTWTVTQTLSINGVASAVRTTTGIPSITNANKQPTSVRMGTTMGGSAGTVRFSNLSHTPTSTDQYSFVSATEGQRLTSLAALVPALTLDTLPTDLGTSLLGLQTSGSVLDLFNEVIRGEQGHIYSVSSGTLLAPVEKVRIRARTRPTAVTATFATTTDIIGAPEMGYDTTNTVSSVAVSGAGARYTSTDKTLEAVVGSANTSASVAFKDLSDIRAFGDDRLIRGVATTIDVFSIVVNARSTSVSRWADLLALTPGLRYRVSGLPPTQLGFTTWDGWFLGAAELHDQENNQFTLYFERTLPATGIFDSDDFMSGGDLTLTAGINAAVTTMSLTTTGARAETVDVPYDLIIDSEIVTVTACTGATPQIATIIRGVGGTTAASHSAGAAPEITPPSLFGY